MATTKKVPTGARALPNGPLVPQQPYLQIRLLESWQVLTENAPWAVRMRLFWLLWPTLGTTMETELKIDTGIGNPLRKDGSTGYGSLWG